MNEGLIEAEGLNKQGGSVWRGRGGHTMAIAIPLGDGCGGVRHYR